MITAVFANSNLAFSRFGIVDFSREDIRKLIYYGWKRGLTTEDIRKENFREIFSHHSRMFCVNFLLMFMRKFKDGNFEIMDKERSGWANKRLL